MKVTPLTQDGRVIELPPGSRITQCRVPGIGWCLVVVRPGQPPLCVTVSVIGDGVTVEEITAA